MYYHASPVKGIKVLTPQVSNHKTPLVYFSTKRENVLVYLSNAIEKCCRETGFFHEDRWTTWASYGFDQNGKLRVEEYYPHALEDTYAGVSGFIYRAQTLCDSGFSVQIPDAAASTLPVPVTGCEFVPDACKAILDAEEKGFLTILRYEQSSPAQLRWIEKTLKEEYKNAQPDYRHFIETKFFR